MNDTNPIKIEYFERKHKRETLAFYYAVFLLVYSLLYFYLYESLSAVIAQIMTLIGLFFSALIVVVNTKKINLKNLILIAYLIGSMFATNIFNQPAWGHMAISVMTLCGVYVFSNTALSCRQLFKVLCLFIVFVILVLLNCNVGNEFYEGKFNPNTGGFVLAMLFCVLFTCFITEKGKNKKLIFAILSILCLALQIVYISRTALLCCLMFSFVCLILRVSKKNVTNHFARRTIFVMAVLGLVVAYVYCLLFNTVGYGKIIIFKKDLFTGREIIWNGAFEAILQNPLFGVGSDLNTKLVMETGNVLLSNAHNQPVGIMVTFGIPVFIIYYYLFSRAIVVSKKCLSMPLLIFVITVVVMSYFDVYFYSVYNVAPILIAYCLIKNRMERSEI